MKKVIQDDIHAKVRLIDDVNIGDMGKIRETFSGTISGACDEVDPETGEMTKKVHFLKGKFTQGNYISSSRLFDKVDGATFENIIFSNIRVSADENEMGIIAKTAANSRFLNVGFVKNSLYNDDDYVGFVAGKATKCSFETIVMQSCDVTTDGTYAGAVVGKSEECTFANVACGTMVYVFADGGGSNAKSGGITGHSIKDTFTNCSHMGMVGGNDDYVGGITGYSEGSNIQSCTNVALIAHCEEDDFGDMQEDREEVLAQLGNADLDDVVRTVASGVIGTTVSGTGLTVMTALLAKAWLPIYEANLAKLHALICISQEAFEAHGTVVEAFAGAPTLGIFTIATLIGLTAIYVTYEATGDSYLAGIAGLAEGGRIDQCSNFGYIYGNHNFIGGIVGDANKVVINNCLNASIVNQERDNHWIDGPYRAGGIVGRGRGNTKITNCLTTNSYHITGISSENNRLDETSCNNFCVGSADHDPKTEFLEMYVSQEMVDRGLVATWLNNGEENRAQGIKPWKQKLKANYLDGWENTPVLNTGDELTLPNITAECRISTPEQLEAFREKINGGDHFAVACLENDIDLSGFDNWEPIGTYNHPFRGIFDGRGFTVKNLKVSKSGTAKQGAGLFGVIDVFANINNVAIGEGSEIVSTASNDGEIHGAAGIVGMLHIDKPRWWGNVILNNCGNYANVTAKKHAAGILGRLYAEENNVHGKVSPYIKLYVDSCYNAGTITASNGNSALLCGYTKDHAVVNKCWSAGHLVSTGSGNAYDSSNSKGEAEYFVGYDKNLDIKDCIAAVDLEDVSQKGVTLYDNDVVYSGQLTYMLNGNDNNPAHKLRWKQDLGKDSAPISCKIHIGTPGERILENKGILYSRRISSATEPYGTLFLPYSIKADSYTDLYTLREAVEEDGVNVFYFTPVDEVPACTPVLYHAKVNGTYEFDDALNDYSFTYTTHLPDESGWYFAGTFREKTYSSAAHIYPVITTSDHTGAILTNSSPATIAPFSAYFFGPNVNDLIAAYKTISIVLDGVGSPITAIESISLPTGENQGEASYTLMGTKAPAGYRGIVIQNGKKYVRK